MRILDKIFSVKNYSNHKIFTILGIKMKFQMKEQPQNEIPNLSLKLHEQYFYNWRNIRPNDELWKQLSSMDIKEKYINLIKNLDDESINTVNLILSRCQAWANGERWISTTDKEIPGLIKHAVELEKNIVKLSDDTYAYHKYLLPRNAFYATVFINEYFINELKSLDKIRNKCILDIGAWIGDSALIFSKYTDNKIYAFEPVSEHIDLIKKTIDLNSLKNVIPINLGVADKTAKGTILVNDFGSRITQKNNQKQTEEIEITTIDAFVKENNIEVGLIKADIEGGEQNMLKGAKETIMSQKPALLISIYHSFDDFFNIKTEIESWNLGYKFKIAKPDDYSIYCDTTLIAEVEE